MRRVSVITITLSRDPLDSSNVGYQPPLPEDQVRYVFYLYYMTSCLVDVNGVVSTVTLTGVIGWGERYDCGCGCGPLLPITCERTRCKMRLCNLRRQLLQDSYC
jgi:hypothetical protein